MATSSTTVWTKGFSENPMGERLDAPSTIELLDLIGDELVRLPAADASAAAPLITRRELLARVLWTRAIMDADAATAKLIIEYLDGKADDWRALTGEAPEFTADDMARAEALYRESLGDDDPS